MKKNLSIVITLFNEEENIAPLLQAIDGNFTPTDNYEVILVDDGSTDNTAAQVKTFSSPDTKLIRLSRNYGQTAAMAAGIAHASGTYIATMDGDLQNDPSDILPMLEKLQRGGWDMVAGNRKDRKDGKWLRKIPSSIANRIIQHLTQVRISDYGCSLKVFKSEIAKNLDLYGELHRFIPILTILQGGKITEMDVKHHARIFGRSKYGLGRTLKVLSDLLLMLFFQKYFKRPIHLFGPIGIFCFLLGLSVNLYLLTIKILGEDIWGRPLLILGISLLLAGIQFLTFGLIAELMMRIYYESQNKKPYRIQEIFEKKSPEIKKIATLV